MVVPQSRTPLAGYPGSTDQDTSAAPSCRLPPDSAQEHNYGNFYATPSDSNTLKRSLPKELDQGDYSSRHKYARTDHNLLPSVSPPLHSHLKTPASSADHYAKWSVPKPHQGSQKSGPISHISNCTVRHSDMDGPSVDSFDDSFDDEEMEQCLQQLDVFETTGLTQHAHEQDDSESVFNLDEFDEDALAELLDGSAEHGDQRPPPSSVVRAYDCDSRSADEFDPRLQHSSPRTSSTATLSNKGSSPLQQDVDWAPVHECVQEMRPDDSQVGYQEMQTAASVGFRPTASATPTLESSLLPVTTTPVQMLLKPHKTFFHIQEMLDAKLEMYRNQPNAVFELFARVSYSSRENIYKKQYFQFRSLLDESPPYINGVLTGWELGGALDCASQEFLSHNATGTKCFCQCKLTQDQESDVGWRIIVLVIQSTNWKTITNVVDLLGRDDLDVPVMGSKM